MDNRKIERLVTPGEFHYVGDGFRVHNFVPGDNGLDQRRMDPFIMLDYNAPMEVKPSDGKPKGVGPHPHRGFETVTIAYKGNVAHHDSHGGGGIIGEGDVQWMTAASGILHKEYYSEDFNKQGGTFQMVQLWVNLPAKDKMSAPRYQSIVKASMPKILLEDGKSYVEIIAGDYQGNKGPAVTFTPVHLLNTKLQAGGKASFDFPANYTVAVLVIEGNAVINGGQKIQTDQLALLDRSTAGFDISADEDAVVLVLAGEPINEPIASYGPFVMNTKEEIIAAMNDFNTGKFGELED
ncbi:MULTISPECIES: pirin family protein [Chitinophagaceae]